MDKQFSKSVLMAALICGGVCVGGAYAYADEVQEFTLDPMVVTATRYEKKDIDIAASTEVFDEERLVATGASNLYEALNYAAGIELQQYGTGGASMGNMASKVVIRGNGNGTLVLINGIPLNLRGTYDLNDIPIENIERVEIVRGGGAVLYGSEATGGVINVITKKSRKNFMKTAFGNYGQQEYVGSFQFENLGFGYKYSKWGNRDDVASDGRDWKGPKNHNFNLSYSFSEALSLSASHNDSKYNYITEGKKATDTEQHVTRNNAQLTYNKDGFKAVAYYLDRTREKEAITLKNGKSSSDEEKNKNLGVDLQQVWNVGEKDKFLLGTNYKRELYTPDGKPEQSRNNFSAYVQYDKQFDKKNNLVLSARESWTTGSPNGYNDDNFSGQIQFNHKVQDNTSLYASVGQSYKMPDLHQIYKTPSGAALEPQTGIHYEIGMKKDIDSYRTLRVAAFSYKVEDNITATFSDNINDFFYKNEDLRNTGVEVEYRLQANEGFGYNVAVAYGNPETRVIDKGVDSGWQRDYSKLDIKAGATYKMGKLKSALNLSYVADRVLSEKETKPYLATNLNVGYSFTDNLSAFCTVNNILDRDDISYRSSSSEYYFTPVNFMVGMKYSF